jgi:CRISPR-associated protein Cas2
MLIMFDLPTNTKDERRVATQFRNFLLKEGFYMIQYSVYVRICNGLDCVEKYRKRIKTAIPALGSVRLLTITEKQYNGVDILVGEATKYDKSAQWHQLTFL